MEEVHSYCNSFASASGFPGVSGSGWLGRARGRTMAGRAKISGIPIMSATDNAPHLPATFNRLAWSNLSAQSAEQIALAAAPIVAVLTLGVGEGQTGLLQTALTLPFILFAIPAGLFADRILSAAPDGGGGSPARRGAARNPHPD